MTRDDRQALTPPLERWATWSPPRGNTNLTEVDTPSGPMLIHSDDRVITPALAQTGVWEPAETAFMQQQLSPGMVALDIGAHCGYFTLLAAQLVGPSGLVMAFEPNPASYDALCRNLWAQELNNVIAVPWAVGARRGWVDLHLSEANTGDHRIIEAEDSRESVRVPLVSIDSLAPLPRPPDFIKIDTQGAEAGVLAGMTSILGSSHDSTWVVEFWPFGLARAGTDPSGFLDGLLHRGFTIRELHPRGSGPADCDVASLLAENPPSDPDKHTNLILSPSGA